MAGNMKPTKFQATPSAAHLSLEPCHFLLCLRGIRTPILEGGAEEARPRRINDLQLFQ